MHRHAMGTCGPANCHRPIILHNGNWRHYGKSQAVIFWWPCMFWIIKIITIIIMFRYATDYDNVS